VEIFNLSIIRLVVDSCVTNTLRHEHLATIRIDS